MAQKCTVSTHPDRKKIDETATAPGDSMSRGGYQRSNQNAQAVIAGMIAQPPVGYLDAHTIAKTLNDTNRARRYTSRRVGCLLRQRDDLVRVSPGKWRVVVRVGV
ncbi:MAG: hypothetical protein M0Q91_15420 [Methanoregula sp.]|jgi:hypothetical protein|nr:hypothetical protein [Methanoregula sp.]